VNSAYHGAGKEDYFEEFAHIERPVQAVTALKEIFSFR